MNVFQQRLSEHQIHRDLEQISQDLDNELKLDLASDQRTVFRRTRRVLDRFQEILSNTDPELFTGSMLNQSIQYLTAVREAVAACKESGSTNVLVKRGDALLDHLSNFVPANPPNSAEKDYREALDQYRELLSNRLVEYETITQQKFKMVEDAKNQVLEQSQFLLQTADENIQAIATIKDTLRNLDETRIAVEQQILACREQVNQLSEHSGQYLQVLEKDAKERIERTAADHEERFKAQESRWNEIQSQRDTNFSDKLNEWSTAFSKNENDREERFTQHQTTRASEFSTWKSERRTEADELIAEWRGRYSTAFAEQSNKADEFSSTQSNRFDQLQKKFSQESTSLLRLAKEAAEEARKNEAEAAGRHRDSIVLLEEEARKLVGIIGNTGVTGNYRNIAENEGRTANLMRWIAIGFLIGLVPLAIGTVWYFHSTQIRWEDIALRLLAGSPFAAIAWYCGSESRRHRESEQRNRRIELELAALDPYLHQLSNEKAESVRETLTAKYFGNGSNENPKVDGKPLDTAMRDALKILEPFVEFAKRFAK